MKTNQTLKRERVTLLNNKKSFSKLTAILLFIVISSTTAFTNNITVGNVTLTGQNTTNDFTLVEFDISWDNSWRINAGSNNYDAAWVFVKYRLKTQTTWNHASLNWTDGTGSGDGHTEPTNTNISSANDNGSGNSYGVFIHRDAVMAQANVSYTDAQLRWNYGDNGLNDGDSVEVCVFAIEMVYVPQGSFALGSGGTEVDPFYLYPTTTNTYTVSSEAAITVGTTAGNLYYATVQHGGDQTGPISANFPKGYDAFYCMKYEISQGQYAEFLNKLTTTQDGNRFPNQNGNDRHTITGSAGARTTTKPNVACNYLSWADLAAYLDWAALRPMSELEYEKACRGNLAAVANEYAWGTTNIAASAYTINNDGAANEGIATNYSTTAGNASYIITDGSINGPLRCGIFAANGSNTGRETAGATYYGIMEMSGNLWKRPVTVGNATGRLFDGQNGNGVLDATGDANTTNWPNTTAIGAGLRGGHWSLIATYLCTSDRSYAAYTSSGQYSSFGGRGVRLAP